jgi:hypothetical protein
MPSSRCKAALEKKKAVAERNLRDSSGVVVSLLSFVRKPPTKTINAKSYLNLGKDMDDFWNELPGAGRIIRRPNVGVVALNDRSVITVSRNSKVRRGLVSRPDHFKQALVLRDAIDGPRRVEDLVSAVPGYNSEQPTRES